MKRFYHQIKSIKSFKWQYYNYKIYHHIIVLVKKKKLCKILIKTKVITYKIHTKLVSNLFRINSVTDVLQARSEANLEIKRREDEMRKMYESEINEIEAANLRSKQEVVNEFNRATNMLKDKINNLNLQWVDEYSLVL